jgi:hypothetical protein
MKVCQNSILVAALGAFAIAVFSGCAGTQATAKQGKNFSRPVVRSTKNASQVAPCCRDLAEGRISLDQCMTKSECRANDNRCCMNAI